MTEDSKPTDFAGYVKFSDTNGDQPVFFTTCDTDFPIRYREKACLNACKAHWDYSSGYVSVHTDNPNRQSKTSNENYIHAVVADPLTFLRCFGKGRIKKANRLEKEGRLLVNQWNKLYGPQAKNQAGVCMPKSTMFLLGTHKWPSRTSYQSEEQAFMLLELTCYSFADSLKESRFHDSSDNSPPAKLTIEDLDVYLKIASTRVNNAKPDKSNTVAASKHTTVFDGLLSQTLLNKELIKNASFDRWGLRMKLPMFLKMLVSPEMKEVVGHCMSVLRVKDICFKEGEEAALGKEDQGEPAKKAAPKRGKKKEQPAAEKRKKQGGEETDKSEAPAAKASKKKPENPEAKEPAGEDVDVVAVEAPSTPKNPPPPPAPARKSKPKKAGAQATRKVKLTYGEDDDASDPEKEEEEEEEAEEVDKDYEPGRELGEEEEEEEEEEFVMETDEEIVECDCSGSESDSDNYLEDKIEDLEGKEVTPTDDESEERAEPSQTQKTEPPKAAKKTAKRTAARRATAKK